jgi:hypothetical protein
MSKAPSFTVSASCSLCHRTSPTISRTIGLCGNCLRAHWPATRPHVDTVQADSRAEFESARHAEEAEAAARAAGLVNVRVGNRHLLG